MDYGIQLEIPGAISSTQPRHAFRVMLDGIRNRVSVSLTDAEANVVFGVARNLSRAGLGMRTQAPLPAHFGERDKLVDCRINLQGGGEIACKVEICNVQSQTRDDGGAYLGGRMVEISRRDSSLLNNFVRQLQLQNFEAYA